MIDPATLCDLIVELRPDVTVNVHRKGDEFVIVAHRPRVWTTAIPYSDLKGGNREVVEAVEAALDLADPEGIWKGESPPAAPDESAEATP